MKVKIAILFLFVLISIQSNAQNIFGFEFKTNEKDSVLVTNVWKNSPAEKAGLQAGENIEFFNGDAISYNQLETIVKIFADAPDKGNKIIVYRNKEAITLTIDKAPLSSFEFICKSNNCNNGECEIEAMYGYTIKGKCSNGKINGNASFYIENKTLIYQGNVVNNKKEGYGIDYLKDNARYEGNFVNGFREGKGTLYYKDNSYLVANWLNNKPEGKAEKYNANNSLVETQTYKDGKKIVEPKPNVTNNNASTTSTNTTTTKKYTNNTSVPVVHPPKKITKDPAPTKAIIDNIYMSTGRTIYFNEYFRDYGPEFNLFPVSSKDQKEILAYFNKLKTKDVKYLFNQCTLENYPSFYKESKNLKALLAGPVMNLRGQEFFRLSTEKDINNFKSGIEYSFIFVYSDYNKHVPPELLSDDGIGFFMCVNSKFVSEEKNPQCIYTPFTLENFEKERGFKNWASKKKVYLIDVTEIDKKFYHSYLSSDEDMKRALNINDVELQELKSYCDHSNFPDGLNTEQKIIDANRNVLLHDYNAYEIYTKGSLHLIYVPTAENKHMPYNLQPKNSDGWYFCVGAGMINYDVNPSYVQTKKATTDASMAQYYEQQKAFQEEQERLSKEKAEWSAKNKFKGVVIYQFEKWNGNTNKTENTYKVITIFGPPNQELLDIDDIEIRKKVGTSYGKIIANEFNEGMDEAQAEKYIESKTGAHRFSVNTNYSYTIPERNNNVSSYKIEKSDLKKANVELDKAEKEFYKLEKDLRDDKSFDRSELAQKSIQDIFKGVPALSSNTKVEIMDVPKTDKYYNENKAHIGKTGVIETTLTENGDGTYYGIVLIDGETKSSVFYKVKVKVAN